jgi:predicted HicB family RNase H-like nuclease
MTDADRYAITLRKVRVDDEDLWRATVRELPDLAEFAQTREEAFDLAVDAIENLKVAAEEAGRSFPEPIEDEDDFSGRVTLRMSKTMHRAVAQRAEREGVSLNSYLVECIAVQSGLTPQTLGAHGYSLATSTLEYISHVLGQASPVYGRTFYGGTVAGGVAGGYTAVIETGTEETLSWAGTGTGVDFNLQLPAANVALITAAAERRRRP